VFYSEFVVDGADATLFTASLLQCGTQSLRVEYVDFRLGRRVELRRRFDGGRATIENVVPRLLPKSADAPNTELESERRVRERSAKGHGLDGRVGVHDRSLRVYESVAGRIRSDREGSGKSRQRLQVERFV